MSQNVEVTVSEKGEEFYFVHQIYCYLREYRV